MAEGRGIMTEVFRLGAIGMNPMATTKVRGPLRTDKAELEGGLFNACRVS
jgi:hypothetical protein